MSADDTQQLAPECPISPLFEPQNEDKSTPDLMIDSTETIDEYTPDLVIDSRETIDESPYVLELRKIKTDVEARLDEIIDSKVGCTTMSGLVASSVPAKRKASEMGADIADSDDEDDDEDVDDVPPHDPTSEALPRLPVYHPGFGLSEQTAKQVLDVFKRFLTKSNYSDDEAKHLLSEVNYHNKIPYGDSVRIGLIGDAGVGKSSAINSILGVANLTVEGDDGDSCTYVVIEFVQSELTQIMPYAATVEFFAVELCIKMVTDLFAQYVQHQQKIQQESDDIDDAEIENASTARECFLVLFAGHSEFADADAAEEFLSTAKSPSDPVVLNKLIRWTKGILNTFVKDGNSTVTLGADTAAGLVEKFIPFTRKVPYGNFNGKPLTYSPWPFVRLIRVSLDSPILRQGIVLADLPGISDINRFRVDAANRYMQNCDFTIVVAKIDRPEKSAQFKRQYMEAFRRRRSGSVVMVITRSDDLNLQGKTNIELDPQDEERMSLIASTTSALDKILESNRVKMEMNRLQGKAAKMNKQLRKQNGKILNRKKALVQERLELRIAARNKKVANTLAQNYRLETRDEGRVPIFCVSNKAYMNYIRGYEKKDPPAMGLVETQVPQVRSFIYALPSKGKFATLDHYCNVSFHTLLSIVQMSCSTTTLARKEHLTGVVIAAKQDIHKQIDALTKKFGDNEAQELVSELGAEAPGSITRKFLKCAQVQCNKYAKLHPLGHRSFIRHNGNWKTKSAGEANWNDDFLKPVRDDIDRAFAKVLDGACETFKAEVAQAIKEAMSDLNYRLKNDPQALVCDAYKECFLDNLERYEADITIMVKKFAEGLTKDFREIHHKACMDGEGHYFATAMLKIYEECDITKATGKGKTVHKSRCEIFEAKMTSQNGPYRSIPVGVLKSSYQALGQNSRLLKSEISGILGRIQKQFEIMATKKNNDTVEGKLFRKQLHGLVEEVKDIFNGPVKESLDLCRQYK